MARSTHLSRREGGRYYLQMRLRRFSPGSPSRLVRLSLGTSDYVTARHLLADRIGWLLPLQTSKSNQQRYQHIRSQLAAFNGQGPVIDRSKLATRLTFEHVVRGLIDDMGGLNQDGAFNTDWMMFCQENLHAEERIAEDDRLSAYEQGRADATRSLGLPRASQAGSIHGSKRQFDPTRPGRGIVLAGQGNGRDTAASDIDVILAQEAALSARSNTAPAQHPDGWLAPQHGTLDGFQLPRAAEPGALVAGQRASDDDHKLLSEFLEEYLAAQRRKKGDDRARSAIAPIVSFAIKLIGDKRPRDYDRADFKMLNQAIPLIPTPKHIPQSVGRDLYSRYRYALDNPDAPTVSASVATIKRNYHSGLDRFFGWLEDHQLIAKAPTFDEVTPNNRVALPRDSFADDEILTFLKLPLFTGCRSRQRCWTEGNYLIQGSLYWQYLILFLTGMRTGEVGPLKVTDLIVFDDFACFDLRPFDARKGRVTLAEVRTQKTSESARIVPIHPLLIELGLLEHRDEMARQGSDRILPDCEPYRLPDGRLRWSQQITKSWQYVKNGVGIVQRADVTLYSTRHTMADMIDQLALSARTRDRVLGHANSSTAAGSYGRKGLLSTEELKQFSGITNPLIDAMREILLPPKQAADAGRLTLIRPTAAFR